MSELEALTQHNVLTVCIDIADPYSLLALPGTLALLERVQQQANWHAFTRPPMQPPANRTSNEDRSTSHRRLRAEYRERELQHYAQALGLPLQRLYENPDSSAFASALNWLGSIVHLEPVVANFLEHTLTGYWSGSLDITDPQTLSHALTAAGANGEDWLQRACSNQQLTTASHEAVETERNTWKRAGIFNTPAYIFNGEVFYGRAHLPIIGQLLRGENAWQR